MIGNAYCPHGRYIDALGRTACATCSPPVDDSGAKKLKAERDRARADATRAKQDVAMLREQNDELNAVVAMQRHRACAAESRLKVAMQRAISLRLR